MTRVLIVSHDRLGRRMAGPAIRTWEFSRALAAQGHAVTLAVPNQSDLQTAGVEVVTYDARTLADLAGQAEVLVVSGLTLNQYPFLGQLDIPLVVDIYDPFHLENLQLFAGRDMSYREQDNAALLRYLGAQLTLGDFFLCASEQQRDYWLGMLTAYGRVNPRTYDQEADLRRLIDVVPFGMQDEPPRSTRRVLKGVHPHIAADDQVILWGGGIYDWFDPLTLLQAMALLVRERENVRLFFMGIKHPNPHVHRMRMTQRAIQMSQELGFYDRFVFFNDWVPYEERGNYLLEADVGVSLHLAHIETRYAFRTRLVDYIWAGLPMVITGGDTLAETVEREGAGYTVGYRDVEGTTAAIRRLLDEPDARSAREGCFRALQAQLSWARAVEPLSRFCAEPYLAPDRETARSALRQPEAQLLVTTPLSDRLAKGWRLLRYEGVKALWREVRSYVEIRRGMWLGDRMRRSKEGKE